MTVQLIIAKTISSPCPAWDKLCAHHIAIEGIRASPVEHMNDTMIEFDIHNDSFDYRVKSSG